MLKKINIILIILFLVFGLAFVYINNFMGINETEEEYIPQFKTETISSDELKEKGYKPAEF